MDIAELKAKREEIKEELILITKSRPMTYSIIKRLDSLGLEIIDRKNFLIVDAQCPRCKYNFPAESYTPEHYKLAEEVNHE